MMQLIAYPPRSEWSELLKRPAASAQSLERAVEEVFTAVRENGDQAVCDFTRQFDGVSLESLAGMPWNPCCMQSLECG